jgi:hypothetical protein
MSTPTGNLPQTTDVNSTTTYFNNYFTDRFTTSPNINDAVVGYFQSVTGDVDTGKTLAATIIYTALSQGLDPMSLVDEFKRMSSGKQTEIKTPIDSTTIVSTYTTYEQIVAHKNEYAVGQVFYGSSTNTFYQTYLIDLTDVVVVQTEFNNPVFALNNGWVAPYGQEFILPPEIENPDIYMQKTYIDQTVQVQSVRGYKRETVNLGNGNYTYNYFYITHTQEKDELTPYLTVLLNTNRANTSLLGIGNSPEVNKYIQRAILA